MTISKELYLSILSLDAYNHGYNSGLTGIGTHIGNATIINIGLPSGFQEAGFYAVAYSVPGIGTVISYRGTDSPGILPSLGDVFFGYPVGLGSPYAVQARMAAEFRAHS